VGRRRVLLWFSYTFFISFSGDCLMLAGWPGALKLDGRALQRVGRVLGVAAVVWAMLAVWASASANAAASVSSNWAGYAVVPSAGGRSAFSSISGSWTVPAATCSNRGDTYSAAWVGLGGFRESSQALEQIGTDADCSGSGGAVYSAWYELVPAAPVALKLKVHAGDAMAASATAKGHGVTLRIRDLSTGKIFTRTRRVSRIDSSSAEWIVEAPSVCVTTNICRTLTLTDFGSVAFSDLSATVGGRLAQSKTRCGAPPSSNCVKLRTSLEAACLRSEHFSRCCPISPVGRRLGICGELGRTGDPDRTADPADAAGLQWGSTLSNVPAVRSYTYLTVSLRALGWCGDAWCHRVSRLCETRCLLCPVTSD
jgi:Peptidase A4 family